MKCVYSGRSAFNRFTLLLSIAASVVMAGCGGGTTSTSSDSLTSSNPAHITVPILPGAAGPISTKIIPSRLTGVAPLAVFFDATGTSSTNSITPFSDLDYRWDFGEAGNSLTAWSHGSGSTYNRNEAHGAVAAHVFEYPGTYTVELAVSDGTYTALNAVQITVQSADAVFAQNTICFSTNSDFTGCPTNPMSGAPSAHVVTSDFASAVNTYIGSYKRLLFHRGQTWTASVAANLDTSGPGLIGAFPAVGSAAAPVWIAPSTVGQPALVLSSVATPSLSDWRISDISVVGDGNPSSDTVATQGVSASGGIDQLLMLRMKFTGLSNALSFPYSTLDAANSDGIVSHRGHHVWDQLAIVDSSVSNINGGSAASGKFAAAISATRLSLMGNSFDSSGGGQHVLLTPYVAKAVISNNYLGQPSSGNSCWQLSAPQQEQIGVLSGGLYSQYVVAANNMLFGGPSAAQLSVAAPDAPGADERLRSIVYESNYYLAGTSTQSGAVTQGQLTDVTLRNNVFNLTAPTVAASVGIIVGSDSGLGSQEDGISLLNNTIYSSGTAPSTGIHLGAGATNVFAMNNLIDFPNASFAQALSVSGSNVGRVILAGNTGSSFISSGSVLAPPTGSGSLAGGDFRIFAPSYAKGAGVNAAIYFDFYWTPRTRPLDIGAVAL